MSDLFGSTRSVVMPNYALLTPQGFVNSSVPGWQDAQCVLVISPRLGADFTQMLVTLNPNGSGQGSDDERERFVFVRDGSVTVRIDAQEAQLQAGGYAFIPSESTFSIAAANGMASLLVFEHVYVPLGGHAKPAPIIANETDVTGAPFMGDEGAMLKTLLPDVPAFDMAVNIFTFQPGATLPIVETHIMEHGLLFIQGQGIYRLGADWHPVQNGDVIWMAPYCPQWFVATGKTPARYIYYKDVNREALL